MIASAWRIPVGGWRRSIENNSVAMMTGSALKAMRKRYDLHWYILKHFFIRSSKPCVIPRLAKNPKSQLGIGFTSRGRIHARGSSRCVCVDVHPYMQTQRHAHMYRGEENNDDTKSWNTSERSLYDA